MKSFAFVFPGQGSQSVGMLSSIASDYPEIEKTYKEASDILGYDLWNIVQNGPSEVLDQTVYTQPALLVGSYAVWRILKSKTDFQPKLLAGHSLGEYTALLCADVFSFQDAVQLVALRGKLMQDAVPIGKGALAAIIGLDDQAVKEICEKAALADEVLTPANFNSPGQIVIAGDKIAVERALVLAKEAGARMAKLLPVSSPSHCSLMEPAALKLKDYLATLTIKKPIFKVMSNVDVKVYQDENMIRDGLVRQLYMPVRWVEIIEYFAKEGIHHIIECGPGKVLTGLNKRIDPNIVLTSTAEAASLNTLFETSSQIE